MRAMVDSFGMHWSGKSLSDGVGVMVVLGAASSRGFWGLAVSVLDNMSPRTRAVPHSL